MAWVLKGEVKDGQKRHSNKGVQGGNKVPRKPAHTAVGQPYARGNDKHHQHDQGRSRFLSFTLRRVFKIEEQLPKRPFREQFQNLGAKEVVLNVLGQVEATQSLSVLQMGV